MSSLPNADAHVLATTARELLAESHDPRVLDICRTLLDLLEPAGGIPLPRDEPPACPVCVRRFAAARRTCRIPLHGPVDSRCAGSGASAHD